MVRILDKQPVASNPPPDNAGFVTEDLRKLRMVTKLFRSGRFEEALGIYRDLRHAHELEADLWNLEGGALLKLGRYEEAAAAVQRALDLQPDEPSTVGLYGAILGQLGRQAEAVEMLRRALADDPSNADTRFNLALAQARVRKHKEAVALIDALLPQERGRDLSDLRRRKSKTNSGVSSGPASPPGPAVNLKGRRLA